MSSFNPNNHISRPSSCHNVILTIFLSLSLSFSLCNVPGSFRRAHYSLCQQTIFYAFETKRKYFLSFTIPWTAQNMKIFSMLSLMLSWYAPWTFLASESSWSEESRIVSSMGHEAIFCVLVVVVVVCRVEWKSFLDSNGKESSSSLFCSDIAFWLSFYRFSVFMEKAKLFPSKRYYFSSCFFLLDNNGWAHAGVDGKMEKMK